MAKFKVGDRVRCVSSANINMQVDMVFTVKALTHNHWVEFQEIGGGWYENRFVLVEEPSKQVPHATPVAHVHAALIKAWADGAKIEFESWLQPGLWLPTGDAPEWSINRNYRIKPEPKPDVVRWFNIGRQLECFPTCQQHPGDNMKAVFDGETGKLKSVEMIKEG